MTTQLLNPNKKSPAAILEQSLQQELRQSTDHVLMIRPHKFYTNPQTLVDNLFQTQLALSAEKIARNAYEEVTHAVATLRSHGVEVTLFEDQTTETPDSVFPNNWFSTHLDHSLIFYPMLVENRRLERKPPIVNFLRQHYSYLAQNSGRVQKQSHSQEESQNSYLNSGYDLSHYESENKILEGTGSIIFDHINHCFYVAHSQRTSDELIEKVAKKLDMKAIAFDSCDESGKPIYHSNVMMSVGSHFVIICLEAVKNQSDREKLLYHFAATNKEVIEISQQQVKHFCGNALELQGKNGKILALSTTAHAALTAQQKQQLSQHVYLQPIHVPTIESAGGSIRCMIAELF